MSIREGISMKKMKKPLSWILTVIMLLSLVTVLPITASAEESYDAEINVVDGSGTGSGWTFASGEIWINADGTYLVSGEGTQTGNRIRVNTGVTASITLDNVNINVALPFEVAGTANATIILKDGSVNIFRSGGGHAGIRVQPSATLTITTVGQSLGDGSLSAYGSADSSSGWATAGIGGSELEPSGTIVIEGGTIFAKGGDGRTPGAWRGPGAAGIGGAQGRACGDITINGGTVTAIGGDVNPEGAGIGGGSSDPSSYAGKITINGGMVRAYSGQAGESGTGIGFCASIAIADAADVQAYSSGNYPAIYGMAAESGHSAYLQNFVLDTRVSSDTDVTITQLDDDTETFEMTLPANYKNFAATVETDNDYNAALSDGSKKIVSLADEDTDFPGICDSPNTALSSVNVKLKANPVCIGASVWRSDGETATVRFVSDTAGTYYYQVTDIATAPAVGDLSGWTSGGPVSADTVAAVSPAGLTTGAKYVHIVVKDTSDDISDVLTVAIPSDYYYFESFEAYPTGTDIASGVLAPIQQINNGTGDADQKVAQSVSDLSGKMLSLSSASGWASDQVVLLESATLASSDAYVFEGDVYPVLSSGFQLRFSFTKGSYEGANEAGVFFNGGKITTATQSGAVELQDSYTAGQWYHVKIVATPSAGTYAVYVDDELLNGMMPLPSGINRLAFSAGNNVNTAAYYDNLEFYTVSIAAPTLQSAKTSADGTKVIMTFDKEMFSPTGKHGQFTVTAGGSGNAVTTAALGTDTKTIELTLTTPITYGQTVMVSYTEGTVSASDGGALASFTNQSVTNNAVVLPSATSVGITGTAAVGQTLTGSYTYNAGSISTEGSTDFRWLRVSGTPSLLGQPYMLYTTNNIDGVGSAPSGPSSPAQFTVTGQTHIAKISNYHYGYDYVPGTISLVDAASTVYGPWDTVNESGYWCAYPNVGVPAGTYTVIDSQPGSWSFNSSSGDAGMTEIVGYSVISGATSQTYTIQPADAGHRILFEVIPEDVDGNRGSAVLSAAFGPVEASASVARIGTTPYPSLGDALTNATGGDTITLLADISYSNAIDASAKDIFIDLNGFDLSVQNVGGHALYAANGYTLTILDANDKGGALSVASIGAGKSAAYAGSGGDILLEGTLSATYPGGLDNQGIFGAYADGIGSTIHITGDASGYTAGIYAQNSAAITVVGDVSGSYYGAYAAYNGSVDVTGDVTGSYALTPEYGGTATVQGDVTGSSFAIFIRNQAGWNAPRAEVTGNVIGTAGGAISAGDAADIEITGDVTGYVVVSGSEATCPVVTVNGDITVSGGFGVSIFYGGTVTVNGSILGASPYLKLNNLDISQGDFEISGDYFKYSNQTVDTPAPFASNTVYVTKANQAPVITSNWNYTTVYFGKDYAYTLTVTDAENTTGTKIYSSLDSAPYSIAWAYPGTPDTQNMTLSPLKGVLAAGSHTLRYYAQDTGGAVSSTLTLTFTVTDEPASPPPTGGGGTPADIGTKITVSTTDGSSSVEGTLTQTNGGSQVVIKNDAFDKVDAADKPVSVDAQLATVTFDKKAMDTIGTASGAGDVTITARQVPGLELSDRDRALVGSRPVYDLTITSGGKTISSFNGGHATVSIPYTLTAGENPHAIVIWYLSDSGKLAGMQGHYDAATKTVVFVTPHFSSFVVGYNLVTFSDVASGVWYHDAVTFLAARGITSGTTVTTFSPNATLTRGQFIVMLLRAYGIEPDSNTADNFSDAGNTYYTGYLAAAKRLGVSNGVGNNMFAPDKSITRQEMFTLLYNALKVIGELPTSTSGKTLSDFSDVSGIASWAKDAMTLLVESGTISGSGGKLNPTETTTRAEMAQVLYNLLTVE